MSDTMMQKRATLHSVFDFRLPDLKSLACSHKYLFFVHLSEDKSDCLTLFLSHYSLCFVFAKCQNIAVSLLQGYITLNALEKKMTNEKRERDLDGAGEKKKKEKRKKEKEWPCIIQLANFVKPTASRLIQLYSQQTCSNAITVSLHCLWKAELVWKALHERQF